MVIYFNLKVIGNDIKLKMLGKIQTILEIIIFLGLAYYLFPNGGNPILWIVKFMFYIIFVFFLTYYISKGLSEFRSYIEKNMYRWLLSGYNTEHNMKYAFLKNHVIQPIVLYLGMLIVDRKKFFYHSKNFVMENILLTIFFIVPFICLCLYMFYILIGILIK